MTIPRPPTAHDIQIPDLAPDEFDRVMERALNAGRPDDAKGGRKRKRTSDQKAPGNPSPKPDKKRGRW